YDHSLAVLADGSVLGWGDDTYGELGLGRNNDFVPTPTPVPGLSNIVAAAAGDNDSLVLGAKGHAWGFGTDYYGELGNGVPTDTEYNSPVEVAVHGLSGIAAGEFHTLGFRVPLHAATARERWRRGAPGAHRLLGLELRELEGRVLRGQAGAALARALRASLRHRRGEQHLLPAAQAAVRRELGRAEPARVPLLCQGVALPHAHQASQRPRPGSRPLLRLHRTHARHAEDGADPLAAAADLPPRRRPARGRARAAGTDERAPLLR